MSEPTGTDPPSEVKIDFVPGDYDDQRHIDEAKFLSAHLRKVRFAVRSLDFVCSVLVVASISHALYLFSRSNVDIWPPGVDFKAQLFLLVVAAMCFLFNSYIIFSYLARNKGMRTAFSRLELGFQLAVTAIFLGAFAFGTSTFFMLKSGAAGNGRNIFKIACERAGRPGVPKEYWGICWTNGWAHVCTIIGVVLNVVLVAFYVLVLVRFFGRRRAARFEQRAAEARSLSLEPYRARGLQTPRLVSEMTKMLPPTA